VKKIGIALWILGVARLASAAQATGNDDPSPPPPASERTDSERIRKLEAEIEQLKAENAGRKAGLPGAVRLDDSGGEGAPSQASSSGLIELRASFTDGFHLKSNDGMFDLHIGGRVEEVYREIFDRPIVGANTGAAAKLQPNTFYFHELFLSLDGTIYNDWGFKINGDFSPQGANATNPTASTATGAPTGGITGTIVEQAWLEYKRYEWFRIQFGQFKSPNEVESIESPLFQELVNRSPMSRFVENWEVGLQFYGSVLDNLFTYNVALMNGRGALANAGRSLVDDNDGKEVDARLTVAPFIPTGDPLLKGLRVGVWGSYAHEGQGGVPGGTNAQGFPPAVGFQSTDFGVSYLEFGASPLVFHGSRSREGAELTYVAGPFELRGEAMIRRDEFIMTGGPDQGRDDKLTMKGYYGQVSCILTGEEKIPGARIIPNHPLDPSAGDWGAFEVAARFGGVSLDRRALNEIFAPGSFIAAGNSNHMTALAAGVNWWFTRNTKLAFDYVAEHYDEGDSFASTPPVNRKHLNGFLSQVQIDF